MRRKLLACLISVGVAAAAVSLHGYVLKSQKWPSGTATQIPFYINPQTPDLLAADAEAAVRAGAAAWSAQSNASMSWYYMGNTTEAAATNNRKNVVFFRNESNGSVIATTYWWSDGSNNLIDTDIALWDAGIKFFAGTSGCSGSYAAYVQDITTHEFGHASGLAHTTVNPAAMYGVYSWCGQSMRNLSSDDKAGIEAIYPPGTSTTTVPTAPGSVTAAAYAANPASSVQLAWHDSATNEDGFTVERSTSGGTFQQVAQLGANATSLVNTGLLSGTTYSFRVRAFNSAGTSAYSNTASATTQTATSTTSSVTLMASGYKVKGVQYASLSWKNMAASQLDVYRNGTRVATAANSGSYTDRINRKGSGTYSYKVCDAGSTTCSNTASVTF